MLRIALNTELRITLIATLQRAARMVARSLRLELV
jgi:hypothetical protein